MTAPLVDESQLRHPWERGIYVASVLLNLLVFGVAIALVASGSDWLARRERLAKYANDARAAALALLLAPPALVFLRNTRRAAVRGSAVRLGPHQLPEIYGSFERMCAALGMSPAPELYVGDAVIDGYSGAYTAWKGQFVVLGVRFLESGLEEIRDVYEFFLGRELGRMRLGHAQWWDELLVSYVVRIPYLRNPLLHARTYSHDRYALFLAPGSLRGLVVQASGRHMLKRMNVDEYLAEARTFGGTWARLANLTRPSPHVALRVRALDDAGLLGRGGAAEGPASALAVSGTVRPVVASGATS
ncbi:MAG TPA: M48 family metallopeptidase [Gemmatimonadaceae bacterium]|nr:M48 family metallopeptidase [Gemmatimonadaceae bacterium]